MAGENLAWFLITVLYYRTGSSRHPTLQKAGIRSSFFIGDVQMINLGKHYEVEHWPDDWTAVTVDGNRSAQFEETLLYVLLSVYPPSIH